MVTPEGQPVCRVYNFPVSSTRDVTGPSEDGSTQESDVHWTLTTNQYTVHPRRGTEGEPEGPGRCRCGPEGYRTGWSFLLQESRVWGPMSWKSEHH